MNTLNSHSSLKSENDSVSSKNSLYLSDFIKGIIKFWWLILILVFIGGSALFLKSVLTYKPIYKASATFTINSNDVYSDIKSGDDKNFAKELSNTFPYLLKTSILQNKICEDIGVDKLPATLLVNSVDDTNMFTLSAEGSNPTQTYNVLISAIENLPEVALYTIGNVKLTMITEPQPPQKPINENAYIRDAIKGALLGLLLGLLWLFAYMLFRETIRTESDIKKHLNGNVIGSLPIVAIKQNPDGSRPSLLINNPMVSLDFLESLRLLRNTILHSLSEDKRVIMITSTAPGEGKTTTCINIAASIAESNKKVLVIDGDIRNSGIGPLLNIEPEFNDSDYVITDYEPLNISVLSFPSDKPLYSMLSVSKLKDMIENLKEEYDLILIDNPPCGLVSDATVMAQVSDTAIFVIMNDAIRVSKIKSAVETLLSTGVSLLGFILNGAVSGMVGSYGSYAYGYGYGYKYKRKADTAPFDNKDEIVKADIEQNSNKTESSENDNKSEQSKTKE